MRNIFNIIQHLFGIDITKYHQLPDEICSVMMKTMPDLKFVSLLTYNKQTDEIIYRSVRFDEKLYDKEKITDLIKPNIILKVSESTSGRLISSKKRFLRCPDVLVDDDYQSTDLASFLGLKAGIFLELRDLMNGQVYGVLILYPAESSPILQISDGDLLILLSVIESLLSNAKRIKENNILKQILDAAKKVRKDVSSFLQKCIGDYE